MLKNGMFQYSPRAMLLERNRMVSSSKRVKQIRVMYYFIMDRVSTGDIVVKHYPTKEMLEDQFTKPLQGALLTKIRAEIQGIPTNTTNEELKLILHQMIYISL